MLHQLRVGALAVVGASTECTLSTSGPAGVEASVVSCRVEANCIYLLVPSTADHLFNLEHSTELVLTAPHWQLRGAGLALSGAGGRHGTIPHGEISRAHRQGYVLIEVFPLRMHLEPDGDRLYRETIDFGL